MILTEEYNDVVVLFQDLLKHPRVNLFDLAGDLQGVFIGQPGQYLIFILDVTYNYKKRNVNYVII